MSDQGDTRPAAAGDQTNGRPEVEPGWERDKRGRLYVKHPSDARRTVWRRGEETIADALARDASAPPQGDKRPRRKSKAPRMPPPPASVDLKALEKMLGEALMAPAMPCAMFGDEWAANHFTSQGPYLARNLVLASENNPWLRRKLEAMATGQDAAAAMIAMVGVAGALFAYAVPPVVWWFNLPVPDRARAMFAIPPARQPNPEPDAEGPKATESAPVAAAA